MVGVDGREGVALKRILLAIKSDSALIVVDIVEQQTVLHLPAWVALYDGSLFLKLYDCNGLVHKSCKSTCLLVDASRVGRCNLRQELLARIVAIYFHGKGCERHKVDAIAFLKCSKVGITKRQAYNITLASAIASQSSHPQDIVVAPLYVP